MMQMEIVWDRTRPGTVVPSADGESTLYLGWRALSMSLRWVEPKRPPLVVDSASWTGRP